MSTRAMFSLLNKIDAIQHKLTDQEYKEIVEDMMNIHRCRASPPLENEYRPEPRDINLHGWLETMKEMHTEENFGGDLGTYIDFVQAREAKVQRVNRDLQWAYFNKLSLGRVLEYNGVRMKIVRIRYESEADIHAVSLEGNRCCTIKFGHVQPLARRVVVIRD